MLRYTKAKTIAAAVGTLATVVVAVFADDVLDLGEVGELTAALLAAAGTIYAVFRVPNKVKTP